jgi:hypothetical protein
VSNFDSLTGKPILPSMIPYFVFTLQPGLPL